VAASQQRRERGVAGRGLADHRRRAVPAAVVHHHHLDQLEAHLAHGGSRHGAQRLEERPQAALLVVHRHDY
jgi:hypothetical protein